MPRPAALVWSSFAAWAIGILVLVLTMWQDANYAGSRDDVAAGLAGLALLIGTAAFVMSTGAGIILGIMATRRSPEQRSASVALGFNVVTLIGVLLSGVILVVL